VNLLGIRDGSDWAEVVDRRRKQIKEDD